MTRGDEVRQRVLTELPELAARHEVPGASVAVWVDGEQIECATGVVNLRTGVPVAPDALFMIQSATKMWTATSVMQLVEEGLVALDESVRRYLPTFRTADPEASGRITVRQLLTHSGGFEGDLWTPTTDGPDALQRFVDDLLPDAEQHSPPGSRFSYCNAGYGVLGRLIEVARGTTYEQALRRWLLEPLALEEVAFTANQALAFRTAIGHGRATAGGPVQPLRVWAVMPAANPAAGNQLAMSARNLLALGRLHLSEGVAPDGTRVLSSAATLAMRTPQITHPASWAAGSAHGLGWFVPGRNGLIEHGGDTIGVASALQVVPDRGFAVAVLTNGDGGHGLIADLVEPLLADYAGVTPPDAPSAPPVTSRAAHPERHVGRYETRVRRTEVTRDAAGRLWMERTWLREGVTMAEIAGVPAETTRAELRWERTAPPDDDVFLVVDDCGSAAGRIALTGQDDRGRALFLHDGRAAPRIG